LKPSRRDILRTGAAFGALLPLGAHATERETLGAAAARAGLTFGTSIAADTLATPPQAALYHRHARILTVDWALTFGHLRPEADQFQTGDAEAILAFANPDDTPVHGHALAWNESRPDWLMKLSTAEKRKALDRHVDETVAHFAGRLPSWNVVNEPFWPGHGLAGDFRDGPWLQAFGPGYVTRAFKRAQAADPKARLVLNEAMAEAWTEDGGRVRSGLLRLVDTLQDAGVRLDAIGLQGHLQPGKPYDDAGFADFLHQLGERKIDLMITELDVDDSAFPDDVSARDAAVAARYRDFLTAVLGVPAVTTVITWQLADPASWYVHMAEQRDPGAARRPRPLPFDTAFEPKPAYAAMLDAFRTRAKG
jgi:endo-1,4-beta-xylanase